jgi:hypothetical protein
MYLRTRKSQKDKWEKTEVNMLDFFCWVLFMTIVLNLSMAALVGIFYAIIL